MEWSGLSLNLTTSPICHSILLAPNKPWIRFVEEVIVFVEGFSSPDTVQKSKFRKEGGKRKTQIRCGRENKKNALQLDTRLLGSAYATSNCFSGSYSQYIIFQRPNFFQKTNKPCSIIANEELRGDRNRCTNTYNALITTALCWPRQVG